MRIDDVFQGRQRLSIRVKAGRHVPLFVRDAPLGDFLFWSGFLPRNGFGCHNYFLSYLRLKRTALIRSMAATDGLSNAIRAILRIGHVGCVSALDVDIQQARLILSCPCRWIGFSSGIDELIHGSSQRARNMSRTVYVLVKKQRHAEL